MICASLALFFSLADIIIAFTYSVHSSPARTTTEVVNAIILSLLIWSKLSGRVKHAALASCLSNALFMAMLRSTTDRKYGSVYLILTVVSGLTSVVSLTAAKKHTWTAAALCAAYALMLGFQHVLYLSQAGQLLQAPVATLCFAMISGCVRFVFTAVCVEQEPVIPDSANIEQTEPTSESDETIDSVKCNTNDFSVVATDGLEDANDVGSNAHREGHSVDHNEDHSVHHSDEHSDDHSATESDIDDDNSPFGEINPLLARSSSYQEQNTSRRELLRYVFHEMRAPLNSICMAVDLLTHHYKAGTTPKSRVLDLETLQIIEEATLTMERTLKDSMTLQKIEEGLLRPQLKIFSVHDLCDDIQDALSSVLQSTSVSLIYNIETAIPEQIAGDHFRVRHVVAHVLSNAIKFSRTGGVVNMKVFLHTLTQEEISSLPMDTIDSARTCSTEDTVPHLRLDAIIGREFVVFSISDNGVGMSSELQESDIFKPFNQLKTEEVNGFRGSGLGLAICKKIMSFLGGSITYSSIEGIGTTFTVMFPLTRLDDDTGEDLVFDRDAFDIPQAPNTSPLGPLVSPRSVKTKAVSHAKSFRGEKLLSILHNQSNVFECPTPKLNSSTSDNFRTSFDFEESPRKFTPPIPIPTSSRPTSGRLAVAFSNSVKGIQMPSVDYGDRQERSEVDDVPMFQLDLEGHSPTRTWKKAMSPSRKQTTEEALDTVNRAISYSMDTLAASSSLHSSFRSDAPSELLDYDSKTYQRSPSQHSPSTLSDTRSPKSDYVTLTEKNVNLHILRTASNEGVRILKQKLGHRKVAATKEELAMILSQCRVLVVDGKSACGLWFLFVWIPVTWLCCTTLHFF